MAIISPKRFQRSRISQAEKTCQLLIFQAISQPGAEWFALPIHSVIQVVPKGEIFTGSAAAGVGLTTYQGKELLVIDLLAKVAKVFNQARLENEVRTAIAGDYLIILSAGQGTPVAIAVDEPPAVRRVPLTALSPLPADYAKQLNTFSVSSLVIEAEQPTRLLLNPEQLL